LRASKFYRSLDRTIVGMLATRTHEIIARQEKGLSWIRDEDLRALLGKLRLGPRSRREDTTGGKKKVRWKPGDWPCHRERKGAQITRPFAGKKGHLQNAQKGSGGAKRSRSRQKRGKPNFNQHLTHTLGKPRFPASPSRRKKGGAGPMETETG